jgi:hypothetical protein
MRRAATLGAVFVVLVGVALSVFEGCDENKGKGYLIPNEPPGVKLIAFPPDSGVAGYDVEFYWEGWDVDGEVDYFLYAIDPPDMYGTADSVWIKTEAHSGSFVFSATDFDTLYHWKDPQIAKSWHVFVIRSVDDMGAISEPDYLAFNAATVAPRTQFTTPAPINAVNSYMGSPQEVGQRVTFRWRGDDVDGLLSDAPVGYLLKVLDVSDKRETELADVVWADTTAWIERGSGVDDRKVVLDFDDGHNYAVVVRAIDEAGAVEPLLLLNGNMMWVGAREQLSEPLMSVGSPDLGRRTWQGWAPDVETYEVPMGSMHEFSFSATCDWYGGVITGFSYGWDISDLESNETDPSGMGVWTPWSMSRTTVAMTFTEARDYFLYVRCKDDGGGRTLATIRFRVIRYRPTKKLCYIDDWKKYPKIGSEGEAEDDEVWQGMLEGYNYGRSWDAISWDGWTAPYGEVMPTLEFLSQFEVVVWSLNDNRSSAINQKSAWFRMSLPQNLNLLAVYMTDTASDGGRGKVWAFGRGLVESSLLASLGVSCRHPYLVDHDQHLGYSCCIKEGSFPFDFLHITGDFSLTYYMSGGARVNLYTGFKDRPINVFVDTVGPAIPKDLYTRPTAAELYPNLPPRIDTREEVAGFTWPYYFEVLDFPRPTQEHQDLFYDPVEEKMTGLIPLYRLSTLDTKSGAYNKYCGFRYVPSGPEDPAEIVYCFFPMFPFDRTQTRELAKVVLSDWFGLPDPDAQGAAGGDGRPGDAGLVK